MYLAATLGTSVDILMKRYSLTDMAKSVVLQACAAAYLEEYCDDLQLSDQGEELKAQNEWLRPRFSPGYGDFDIHHQDDILRMAGYGKEDRTYHDRQLYAHADKIGDCNHWDQ